MSSGLPQINYVRATEVDSYAIIDFWKRNNITVTPTDSAEELEVAAKLHPELFIVALTTGGRIIGTVWGGFDGRRGYVAHLAVDAPFRSRGLGSLLMKQVETEFKKMNVYKVHLFVEDRNASVGDFYRRQGYTERTDLTVFSKTLH